MRFLDSPNEKNQAADVESWIYLKSKNQSNFELDFLYQHEP